MKRAPLITSLLLVCSAAMASGQTYYTEQPLFHFHPDPDKSVNLVGRLGPIGLGLELRKPAFTMQIKHVEPGSPADKTGKLKPGQIIESINGEVLKDLDPRVILGNLITKIEATDGAVRLMVKDQPKAEAYRVDFKIPVLGSYSDTWPEDCAKSDAIVKNMSRYLRESDEWGWGAALFLLSTGESEDLEAVRRHFSGKDLGRGAHTWGIGYKGIAICEYYLRTGDESVLPAIKARHDQLLDTVYNDSWMGRGGANFNYMSGGHLNAAGLHAVTFLLMAKECGIEVNEPLLLATFRHLYRYAGRGVVAYGDQMPERGLSDNGKVGKLAFVLQAAANLSPEGENSVYARARDICATKSFYSTSWLFHGHTGGGIGELWRGPAMGIVKDKRPDQYRSFMDERRWMYELARTHEGAFGWAEGHNVGYSGVNDVTRPGGNYVPLIYTLPRKQLRIFGAPPTRHSRTFQLPERIWGTAADDAFYSLEPGESAEGKRLDISGETIRNGASLAIFNRLKEPDIPEQELLNHALHIDQAIRDSAVGQINQRGLHQLTIRLLRSKDPRGRQAGAKGIAGLPEAMTDEVVNRLISMIEDEEESWWVVMTALQALEGASAGQLRPHLPAIERWLDHDDWWLQASALKALSSLVTDPDSYQKVIPRIAQLMQRNQRASLSWEFQKIAKLTQNAESDIQAFAADEFATAYSAFPNQITAPGIQDMTSGTQYILERVAETLAETPGGLDALYLVAKERFPEVTLPHKDLYIEADASTLGPELKSAMTKIILDDLIPEYIGSGTHPQSNRAYLLNEATSADPLKFGYYYKVPKMTRLVELYERAGVNDYAWSNYGAEKREVEWQYHSFDPPEQKVWKPGDTRYRKVTYPEGMDQWFQPGFAAREAGWKSGPAPFGQLDGKISAGNPGCSHHYCDCSRPARTLWENEVLLMRTKVDFPEFKDGHIYRIVLGGMAHNFAGDGFRIYVNGKSIFEQKRGTPMRWVGDPVCYYIDKQWWPEFGRDTTIAATGFLAIPGGRRSPGVKKGYFDIWIQEMKAPPMDRETILRSAMKVPMSLPGGGEAPKGFTRTEEGEFLWDGKFQANPSVVGEWTQVGRVSSIDEFQPGQKPQQDRKAWLQNIRIDPHGVTDDELIIWSGRTLMNLKTNGALRIEAQRIGGEDLLFIQTGEFQAKQTPDKQTPYYVMRRK